MGKGKKTMLKWIAPKRKRDDRKMIESYGGAETRDSHEVSKIH